MKLGNSFIIKVVLDLNKFAEESSSADVKIKPLVSSLEKCRKCQHWQTVLGRNLLNILSKFRTQALHDLQ